MFLDRSSIRAGLFGRVGFHNAINPNYPTLIPSLLQSISGLYYNDGHALLTIENIDQSATNYSAYNYTAFNTVTRDAGGYTTGSKVSYSSVNYEYIASVASSASTPLPDADDTVWREIDELSDYLVKSVYRGIDTMLDTYMNRKKNRERSKSIFENLLIYQGVTDSSELETNSDKFVGIRIQFKKKEKHIVNIINAIGHNFSSDFEGLDIKVYYDSVQDPIYTYSIDHTTGKTFQWTSLSSNNTLRYYDTYDAGGAFYIGYKQSDLEALGAQAINKNVTWSVNNPTDDDVWRNYYQQFSDIIDVIGFSVLESNMPSDKMFDPDKLTLQPYKNYGLNFNITIDSDLTPFFLQEARTIDNALKHNVAMVLMEGLAYSTRGSNQISNHVKDQAEKQLFHHSGAYGTLYDKLKEADNGLSFDFSDMDNSVMPSDSKFTLKVRRGAM